MDYNETHFTLLQSTALPTELSKDDDDDIWHR